MKKPREFYVAVHKDYDTVPFCVAKHKNSLFSGIAQFDITDFEIIKVKEFTDAKNRKTKAPRKVRKARTARKVQATARKRKAKD